MDIVMNVLEEPNTLWGGEIEFFVAKFSHTLFCFRLPNSRLQEHEHIIYENCNSDEVAQIYEIENAINGDYKTVTYNLLERVRESFFYCMLPMIKGSFVGVVRCGHLW